MHHLYAKAIKVIVATSVAVGILFFFASRPKVVGGTCGECPISEPEEAQVTKEAGDPISEDSEVIATKTRRMVVTGYTSSPLETDETPCIAAFGDNICQLLASGMNICATNAYSYRSELYIDGLGKCYVYDRMNSRYTNRIDWYFGFDRQAALNHGVKTMNVEILYEP